MERYSVKALSVSGLGNKVHHLNEVVTAKNFPPGAIPQLVNKGFLKKAASAEDKSNEDNNEEDKKKASTGRKAVSGRKTK